jgi:hypothetical protein
LSQVLKRIGLLLRDESGSFPTLHLAGADLQYSLDVLTAVAGHSSVLPQVVRAAWVIEFPI